MVRWARDWSLQKVGSSAALFSSARRRVAVSTSKMPPQQSHRLLDLFDEALGFRAHVNSNAAKSLNRWRRFDSV
jgi:hypothetical protein